MGRITASVACDFGNVLTIIKCYTQIVTEALRNNSELLPKVLEIDKAADRAISMTGQLLAFSRRQAIDRNVVGMNQILAGTEMMLQRLLGPQIALMLRYETELDLIYVDRGQMVQMVLTLAAVARDTMPQGGNLLIETTGVVMDANFCSLHPGARKGEYVCLTMRDSGEGMSPDELRRIMDPFVNATERLKGRGIELTSVYGIVKQNGGYILLDGGQASGTLVSIYLPLAMDRRKDSGRGGLQANNQANTVLVVESLKAFRELICELLRNDGYKTICASSGEEAIELAAEFDGAIQLVVADLILPGMSGVDLADCLASSHPGARTLYVSGYAEDVAIYGSRLYRNADFIAAPFTAEEFLGKLRILSPVE